MDLLNPWVFLWTAIAATVVALLVIIFRWARRRIRLGANRPVTNSYRLTDLPEYRSRVNRYRVFLGAAMLLMLTTIVATAIVAARPVQSTLYSPDKYNRDIVLCLDVSGSMVDYDKQLLGQFLEMVDEFEGERVSLVLWDSSATQIFPLTDDYQFLTDELTKVHDSLFNYGERNNYLYWIGTNLGEGYSLIGDGLASCTLRFDMMDDERSRSIIFATDNFLNGEPIIELTEAAELAAALDISVYGVLAQPYGMSEQEIEFRDAMVNNGHRYFVANNPSLVNEIVTRVQSDQASHYKAPAQWIRNDDPALWMAVLAALFALYLAVTWRVRL